MRALAAAKVADRSGRRDRREASSVSSSAVRIAGRGGTCDTRRSVQSMGTARRESRRASCAMCGHAWGGDSRRGSRGGSAVVREVDHLLGRLAFCGRRRLQSRAGVGQPAIDFARRIRFYLGHGQRKVPLDALLRLGWRPRRCAAVRGSLAYRVR
ncbi:hypothetical protein T492DRAFT_848837 [Pavlovales sp. CCMP2436]|nr:hypothetical protein T492DRAFT_848837 [Pavlovales sp. CCMP2436]